MDIGLGRRLQIESLPYGRYRVTRQKELLIKWRVWRGSILWCWGRKRFRDVVVVYCFDFLVGFGDYSVYEEEGLEVL